MDTLFDLAPAGPQWDAPALFPEAEAEAYLIGRPRPSGPAVEYPEQQLTMPGMRPDAVQGALTLA